MEKHESSKGTESKHEGQSHSAGLGLGLDVNLDLRLGELRNALTMLTDALKETGNAATDLLGNAIGKIREIGVENFTNWGTQGNQEQKDAYHQLVSKLQDAANRGEQEARNLLQSLGENVESAGQKMQSAASEEGEARH